MNELPSIDQLRRILGPETAFIHYLDHINSKARKLGLRPLQAGVHSEDPWRELLDSMQATQADAKDDSTCAEFRKSVLLYLERLEALLARYDQLCDFPWASIWTDVLDGKYLPQDLTFDELLLLDAVTSDANPQSTLSSTLAKNRLLLELEVPNALVEHVAKLVFVNSITALEAYLAATLIKGVINNHTLLRRFVENNPEFSLRKFTLAEVFTKLETIGDETRKYLLKVLWHDLGKVKAIYESVFDITFPNFSDLARAVLTRHDLVHRNGFTADGRPVTLTRDEIENLIDQIKHFQKDLDSQLTLSLVK